MKEILLTILATVGVLVLLCSIAVLVFTYNLSKSLERKTDPSLYADIVTERLEWSNEYQFLPRTIPKDAVKVAFLHSPGFLQGSDDIALRVTLPPARVRALLKTLEDGAQTEITPSDDAQGGHICPYYPLYDEEKLSSQDADEFVYVLPRSYRIFEHRTARAFTAVSIDTNEVFYFIASK